jgi:peptidoglycan hydrolase-like protein with peptidoglycan-binding domain
VTGTWSAHGNTLVFTPSVGYKPWAKEKVTVPHSLASPGKVYTFGVAGAPLLRAQQLLAELGYLPLNFTDEPNQFFLDNEPKKAALVSPVPQPGWFTWAYANIPPSLAALWAPGQANVLTQGAIMHFEAVEGLPTDGVIGPQMWADLAAAAAGRHFDPVPYDYLIASEALPETLVVWQDGSYVFSTPVNTGVAGAATEPGTFPVYARYITTEMKGTDPDGVKYDVPDVPWVAYFNGGDAVHGYPRYSYGWPQSNGCVELPISNAQVVWGMDPIGTLVTVTGDPLPAS